DRRAGTRAEDAVGAMGVEAEQAQPALRLRPPAAAEIGFARVDHGLAALAVELCRRALALRLGLLPRRIGKGRKALARVRGEAAVGIGIAIAAKSLLRAGDHRLLEGLFLALCRIGLAGILGGAGRGGFPGALFGFA